MIKAINKVVIDHRGVMLRVRAKRNRVLYQTGAYTRTSESRRIRTRKKKSKPGQGPTNQTRRLKSGVKFTVDELEGTVVAGITPNTGKSNSTPLGGKTIPQLIDQGGKSRVVDPFTGKTSIVDYGPRPITDPVRPKAEEFFRKKIETVQL